MSDTEVKKRKKWYRRLFSCICSDTTQDYKDYEFLPILYDHGQSVARTLFESSLEELDLLYRAAPVNGHPVLNLGFGLKDEDLVSKKCFFVSYTNFRSGCLQAGFEKLAEDLYFNEPIVDGLPASLWLECIEPTLAILTSLNNLKHRRSNLSVKKPRPNRPDSQNSRHGDYDVRPLAIRRTVPRTVSMRIDFVLYGNQNITEEAFELRLHREHNRRRNRQHPITVNLLSSELNMNQSANTEDVSEEHEDVGLTPEHTKTLSTSLPNVRIVLIKEAPTGLRASVMNNKESEKLDQQWQDLVETGHQVYRKVDTCHHEDCIISTGDNVDTTKKDYQKETSVSVHRVKGESCLFKPKVSQQSFLSKLPAIGDGYKPYKLRWTLWDSELKQFIYTHRDNYKLEDVKVIKEGIKYFLWMDPDSPLYSDYADMVCRMTGDFFSRRLLMNLAKSLYDQERITFTPEEFVDAKLFLKLEEVFNGHDREVLKKKIVKDGTCAFFSIRRQFSRLQRWIRNKRSKRMNRRATA